MIIGILPAAGKSSRLGGVAKFSLPLADIERDESGSLRAGQSLLEKHLQGMLEVVDHCVIASSLQNAPALAHFTSDERVTVQIIDSGSLSQTIRMATAPWRELNATFVLEFPDAAYLPWSQPAQSLFEGPLPDLVLGLWAFERQQRGKLGQILLDSSGSVRGHQDKNPDCNYPFIWGAMTFSQSFVDLLDPDQDSLASAIDRAIEDQGFSVIGRIHQGSYFDVGTVSGLHDYISAVVGQKG